MQNLSKQNVSLIYMYLIRVSTDAISSTVFFRFVSSFLEIISSNPKNIQNYCKQEPPICNSFEWEAGFSFWTNVDILLQPIPISQPAYSHKRNAKTHKSNLFRQFSLFRNISLQLISTISDAGVDVVIPHICHFFYTGKIFGE